MRLSLLAVLLLQRSEFGTELADLVFRFGICAFFTIASTFCFLVLYFSKIYVKIENDRLVGRVMTGVRCGSIRRLSWKTKASEK